MENRPQYWLTVFLIAAACSPVVGAEARRMQMVMGTVLEIEAEAGNEKAASSAVEAGFTEARKWDDLLSNYKPDSEISRINREAYPQSTIARQDVIDFLKESVRLSSATSGAFDVTIEPLTRLWRLRERKLNSVPGDKEIDKARFKVNYKNLDIYDTDNTVWFILEGMAIDTGGIGKGYALDRALAAMRRAGAQSATLNFGGEILYWRRNPARQTVSVRSPIETEKIWKSFGVSLSSNQPAAFSTTGNYERYIIVESSPPRKLGHILDPKSGKPVENSLRSVTVLSGGAAEADALSTGIFVMGLANGVKFAEKSDIAAFVIYESTPGTLAEYASPQWDERTR